MNFRQAILLLLLLLAPGHSFSEDLNVQQQKPPAQPSSEGQGKKPRIQGSMVGYIDDAVIGSQVRFRFDAAWHTQSPDRAEYFYAKCGCYNSQLAGTGSAAFDPKAPGPQGGAATDLNFQQLYMEAEYAVSSRLSFFGEIPVRWIQPKSFASDTGTFSNQSGLSDLQAGVKAGLFTGEGSALTFQFKSYFPTGDPARGLGVNHYSIEPGLLYYQKVGSRGAIESQFLFWHPIGGSQGVATLSINPNPGSFAGDVVSYGVGPSVEVYNKGRIRVAPVVELVGWSVLGGFQTAWVNEANTSTTASGTNILNLKAGVRTTVGSRNSLYVGYGRGLTNAVWYKDLVRAEYRFTF
jgi:hypothetical protein